MASGFMVLMYHRVLPDELAGRYPLSDLVVPLSLFERQVAYMAGRYTLTTVGDAMGTAGADNAQPCVCITFDDGHYDQHEHAARVLDAHGVRGTFFLTAGLIGTERVHWFDRMAALWVGGSRAACVEAAREHVGVEVADLQGWMNALTFNTQGVRRAMVEALSGEPADAGLVELARVMSWGDVRDLVARGHEVASHGLTHQPLATCDERTQRRELSESKRLLETELGGPVTGFSYPNGSFDDAVVGSAREAGYGYAVTAAGGLNGGAGDSMRLGRRNMHADHCVDRRGRFVPLGLRAELCGYRQAVRDMSGR